MSYLPLVLILLQHLEDQGLHALPKYKRMKMNIYGSDYTTISDD